MEHNEEFSGEEGDPETFTPLTKIRKNFSELTDEDYSKELVVLISTGAFSPVHFMHIKQFEIAKEVLERDHNIKVIGGLISPSHDHYVIPKMRKKGSKEIDSKHRIEMCQKALKDHPWIDVDRWEATRDRFISFSSVVKHTGKTIQKLIGVQVRTLMVCGADLLVRAPRCVSVLQKNNGVVCVSRPLWTVKAANLFPGKENPRKLRLYFANGEEADISSTLIRENLAVGKSIEMLTFPQVIEHMKQHQLF